jgi:hypothetical protein
VASYKRRAEDWKEQRRQAEKELAQVERQIAAARIRHDIAKTELRNHELQMRHSAEVTAWMQSKYTNQELYDWMVGQLSALHFQAYQLALATAKKAERCYQHEMGIDPTGDNPTTFIGAVYWDSLRKGLLAGEKLAADLDRMDIAYLDNDVREYELVKHVSLARLDPLSLERLKKDGECWFEVPKVAYDADCPGHYFRRLQSVALSIACVAGSNGTVNAQLTLYGHYLERTPSTADPSSDDWNSDGTPSSIVTSAAVNDAGVFSADPKDPRYLPFERRGAISRWYLKLTADTWKQLEWDSITDVTLHVRYTARDGGDDIAGEVSDNLATALNAMDIGYADSGFATHLDTSSAADPWGNPVAFSAKRDFADAWFAAQDGPAAFELDLDGSLLPDITSLTAYTRVLVVPVSSATAPTLSLNGGATTDWTVVSNTLGTVHWSLFSRSTGAITSADTLSIAITGIASLDDLVVVLLP